jgi:hypothetical protein
MHTESSAASFKFSHLKVRKWDMEKNCIPSYFITSFTQNFFHNFLHRILSYIIVKPTTHTYIAYYQDFYFLFLWIIFFPILWCSHNDDHPPEGLAKCGYFKNEIKFLWQLCSSYSELYIYIYIYVFVPESLISGDF